MPIEQDVGTLELKTLKMLYTCKSLSSQFQERTGTD